MIRKLAAAFAAVLAGAVLGVQGMAMGSEADFPSNYRGVFVTDCTESGATVADCHCMWRGVANAFTVPEYDSLDAASRAGTSASHPLMPRLQNVVNQCAAEPGRRNSQGYPAEYQQNFMSACTGGGAAHDLCACAYRHLETEYTVAEFTEMDDHAMRGAPHPNDARVGQIVQSCAANTNW